MNRRQFVRTSAFVASGQVIARPLRSLTFQEHVDGALAEKLSRDPLRPQYHLLPQAGFLGDPCAPRFYRGQYHAFFHGSVGGRGWHHAISPDLVHWRHMPIALAPTQGLYDSYGTFTGSVLPSDEGASIVYTGTTKVPPDQETIRHEQIREVQCIATTTDPDLGTWHKLVAPVIANPPQNVKVTGFRDPFSWKEDDIWYMGVGSGVSHVGGMVLLYRSADARHWEYLHPLAQGQWNGETSSNPVPSGEMWECPDFFECGSKHVLLYSSQGKTFWQTGTFDRKQLRFCVERSGLLDYGAYYAPKSMLDSSGRRILWGWIQEGRSPEEIASAGWAGCMSLPRVLTVDQSGDLAVQVASEFNALLSNTVQLTSNLSAGERARVFERIAFPGRSGHLELTFMANDKPFSLQLVLDTTGLSTPLLTISYAGNAHGFRALRVNEHVLPLSPDEDKRSNLVLWMDGSVIEVFVDRRYAVTTRSYVLGSSSDTVRLKLVDDTQSVLCLSASEVVSISSDRLTT